MTRATSPEGDLFLSGDNWLPPPSNLRGAKKRLIATHANSKIAATRSQQTTSHFLIATKSVFPFRFLLVHHGSQATDHAKVRAR